MSHPSLWKYPGDTCGVKNICEIMTAREQIWKSEREDIPSSAIAAFSVQPSVFSALKAAFSAPHSLFWAQTHAWQEKKKCEFYNSWTRNTHLNGKATCMLHQWLRAAASPAPQTWPFGVRWLSPSVSSENKQSAEQTLRTFMSCDALSWLNIHRAALTLNVPE